MPAYKILLVIVWALQSWSLALENLPFKDISECKPGEYFNVDNFQCEPCSAANNLVPSLDSKYFSSSFIN